MDGAQIDGNFVRVKFTLVQRRKTSPPPSAITAAPKREAPQKDKVATENDKDIQQRPRESSPWHNFLHLYDNSLPGIRELTYQGVNTILSIAVIWICRFVAEQIPLLIDMVDHLHLGGGWPLLEDVLHPQFHGGSHLHVVLQEEGEAAQFASALHFLLRDDHHQGEPEALHSRRRSCSLVQRPIRFHSRSASPRRGRAPFQKPGRPSPTYFGSPGPRKVARKVSRSSSPKRVVTC